MNSKNSVVSEEINYINLIKLVLSSGKIKKNRTGKDCISYFGFQARYSLVDGTFPLLTTKKMFTRAIIEELLWFIKGSTNANILKEKGVRIWESNASREYLDSIGLYTREQGDLGPVYGFQWRHFGAVYENMHTDYSNQGVDQLLQVINQLKHDPDSRRIILSAWNPVDLPKMALPPCHAFVQFYHNDGNLSCQLYQRSADIGLGVPFNIASYALLTHIIAHVTNLKAYEFIHSIGDAHIYVNHVDALQEQILRNPYPFPKLNIKRTVENIEDFKLDDFEIKDYISHPKILMEIAV